MADRLRVYNRALTILAEASLADLNENRNARYVLDREFDETVLSCLDDGAWNFAIRSQRIEHAEDIQSDLGYQYAFWKPEDFVRLVGISPDEGFVNPLVQYRDEGPNWLANEDMIFVRFVSKHLKWGLDLGRWPVRFQRYVEAQLAADCAQDIRESKFKDAHALAMLRKSQALAKDAMEQPPERKPVGSWRRSRYANLGSRPHSRS